MAHILGRIPDYLLAVHATLTSKPVNATTSSDGNNMSTNYGPQHPPPPGQGYYSGQPHPPRESRRHRRSRDGSVSPRDSQNHFASQSQPSDYQESYHQPYDPRQYSEAPPPQEDDFHPPNQLAPYDEEKAFAEWNRAYGPGTAYDAAMNAPPPQTTRQHVRQRSLDDRRRRYEDDIDYYDDRSVDRRPPPRRRRRPHRRDSTQSVSDYQTKPETKDLGPTLMASAAGAFLGRKMVSKGALGIVGGAIAGALGANAGEHLDERKRRRDQKREEARREEDERYYREREDERYYREREDERRYSRRTRSPRDSVRETETVASRRRPRDLSRAPPRTKRYVGSSPDSRVSV